MICAIISNPVVVTATMFCRAYETRLRDTVGDLIAEYLMNDSRLTDAQNVIVRQALDAMIVRPSAAAVNEALSLCLVEDSFTAVRLSAKRAVVSSENTSLNKRRR